MILDHLPWAAAAAGLVVFALAAWPGTDPRNVRRAATVSAALALASFLWLVGRFIVLDLAHEYVYLYTREGMPLRYRVAGAWAGREGSLMLWAMWSAVVTAGLAWWHRRPARDGAEQTARVWTTRLLALVTFAFLGAAAWQTPFSATPAFLLEGRPGGNGLNPTLQSPFILIHPPVMFLAYALTAVPAAAGLGHMLVGHDRWSRIGLLPSRLDWVLYTFAMGLGGIWAYFTLGFGGYWAWDPVEVANLLPWLALTLLLHAQLHHARHGRYKTIGPLLAVLPFLLTIFSTLSTRSGLWVSVHAFTDPANTFDADPAARVLDILAAEPGLGFHAALFFGTTALMLALWTRRLAADLDVAHRFARVIGALLAAFAAVAFLAPATAIGLLFEAASALTGGRTGLGLLAVAGVMFLGAAWPALAHQPESGPRPRDVRALGYVAVLVLGLSLVVLVLFHFAAVRGWSEAFYTERLAWLATPALLGILVFMLGPKVRRRALVQAAAIWAAAGLAWLAVRALPALRPGLGPEAADGAYLGVLAGAVVVQALRRTVHAWMPGTRAEATAPALYFLAALLDLLFWLNPPAVRLGIDLRPMWPAQLVMGALALGALWLAERRLAGRPVGPTWLTPLAVGLLGGFYVAPVLALAGFMLERRRRPFGDEAAPTHKAGHAARTRRAAVYAVHAAIGLALVGYAASTYYAHETEAELGVDETLDIGGLRLVHTGTAIVLDGQGGAVDEVRPALEVQRRDVVGTSEAVLAWEPQSASHYPLPAVLRLWDRDVAWNVDGVCIDPAAACDQAGHWVRAYESGGRLVDGQEVTKVQLTVHVLPGLGVVWTALALLVWYVTRIVLSTPAHERA